MAGFALGTTTLLLFQLGNSASDIDAGVRGLIPGHGPSQDLLSSLLPSGVSDPVEAEAKRQSGGAKLKQHFCLAVSNPGDVAHWDAHFQRLGIRILGRMDWERGGNSVYFEDLDGHVGEIGSRGIWRHFDLD
jgi:catechol 2,3-dioxygenase-like lactoylglutathione lyase family enzyme